MQAKSFKANTPSVLETELLHHLKTGFRPSLGFVFCSVHQDFDEIGRLFHQYGIELLGCTTAGEIVNNKLFNQNIAVLLLDIDKAYFKKVFIRNKSVPSHQNTVEEASFGEGIFNAARHLRSLADQAFENPALIVCTSGVLNDGEKIVAGLKYDSTREIPIFGGLAGDDLKIEATYVFTQEESSDNALGAIVFDADKVEVLGLATSGWEPLGTFHTVTKATGNVIHTINEEPALDYFIRFFGQYDDANVQENSLSTMSAQYPFQVERDGQYAVLRTPIRSDEENRTLTLVGSVKEGDRFRFSISPGLRVIEKTVREFEQFEQKQQEADALILFSCKGRHAALGPFLEDEINGIYNFWQKPMTGFLSYGEIGNIHEDVCEFHNETCCLVILREK
jgi:hypothetical protein